MSKWMNSFYFHWGSLSTLLVHIWFLGLYARKFSPLISFIYFLWPYKQQHTSWIFHCKQLARSLSRTNNQPNHNPLHWTNERMDRHRRIIQRRFHNSIFLSLDVFLVDLVLNTFRKSNNPSFALSFQDDLYGEIYNGNTFKQIPWCYAYNHDLESSAGPGWSWSLFWSCD